MRGVGLFWITAILATPLAGCAASKNAWQHYDECGGGGFASMVDCGSQKRAAYCRDAFNCSGNGDAIVSYAESLKRSVQKGELSETEATRKWIEFRSTQVVAAQD